MVNQNFINFMTLVGTASNNNEIKHVKKIDGSNVDIYRDSRFYLSSVANKANQSYTNSILNENSPINNGICVFGFGTGNITPTLKDFNLDKIIADPVFVYQTSEYRLNNIVDQVQQIMTATYKYTGSDMTNISEIGLFVKLFGTDRTTPHSFMIARDVLSNPITVSNGDVFTVTMVLS